MDDIQRAFYMRFRKMVKPIFDITIDTSIMNPQHVIEEGPCIIVANHRSDLDPFIILTNVRRPINWLGASYLWNMPGGKWFMEGMGAISVSKYRSDILRAFEQAAKELENGQAVGIFPEGWDYIAENQFDWSVGKFNTGFARIAIQTGAPVVPMAMLGLDEKRLPQAFPPFIRKMLEYPVEMQYIKDRCAYRKLHINVGKPMYPPKGADMKDREAVSAFTLEVNEMVADLYCEIPEVAGFENIEPRPAGPHWPEEFLPPEDDEESDGEEGDEKMPPMA
ncbi:lysophospholipid acyltransferase family protein [bacterium]